MLNQLSHPGAPRGHFSIGYLLQPFTTAQEAAILPASQQAAAPQLFHLQVSLGACPGRHSVLEWGRWKGLGARPTLGCRSGPPPPGWTLARPGGNRGEESEAGPQDSWSGLRRVTGLAQVQG